MSLRTQFNRTLPGALSTGVRGFTLLELLVAIVAVSVGVLGVASLQLLNTSGHFEAGQRLQATMLANDIIDRMRANPDQISVYAGSDLDASAAPTSTPPSCPDGASAHTCRAQRDRWELAWAAYRSDTLSDTRACVTEGAASADGTEVTVVVAWRGMAQRGAGAATDLEPCGVSEIGADNLKQVVITSFVTKHILGK